MQARIEQAGQLGRFDATAAAAADQVVDATLQGRELRASKAGGGAA